MTRNGPVFAATVCWLLATAEPIAGQGVLLDQPTGVLGAGFDGAWADATATPGTAERTFNEWLQLNVAGAYKHPRIFAFTFGLRPYLTQANVTRGLDSQSSRNNRVNGDVTLNIFSGAPLSLLLTGRLRDGRRRAQFDGDVDQTSQVWEGRLLYRLPYFPTELRYRDESRDEEWRRVSGNTLRTSTRRRALQFSAKNSKTNIYLRRTWFDDRVSDQNEVFDQAGLSHMFRWGKGSSLWSFLSYQRDRAQERFQGRSLSWSQAVQLQHTLKASSTYRYRIASQKTLYGSSHELQGDISAAYRIRRNIGVRATGSSWSRQTNSARTSLVSVKPGASFGTRLPLGFRLTGDLSVGHEWFDQGTSKELWGEVLNERHVVDRSTTFRLEQPYVDPVSIVVTSDAEGTIYEEGFDYQILVSGPITEIFIVPGGRIQFGETLLIDYRFELVPEQSSSARTVDYGAELGLWKLTVRHRRSVLDELSAERAPGVMTRNRDVRTTEISFAHRIGRGTFDLGAQHSSTATDSYHYKLYRAHGGASYRFDGLHGRLGLRSEHRRNGGSPVDIYSGDASLDWTLLRSLQLRGTLMASRWLQERDRFTLFTGGIGADYRYRRLALQLAYHHNVRADGRRYTEDRITLNLSRSF